MAYLELEHLQVAFAGKTVLHVEKASFNRGKIYVIVGPSGS